MTITQISNANILNPKDGTILEGATLVAEDGEIKSVGKDTSNTPDIAIDAAGRTVFVVFSSSRCRCRRIFTL